MSMKAIGSAWQAASGRQKITIGVALVIALGGLIQILQPSNGSPSTAAAASASFAPSQAVATETATPHPTPSLAMATATLAPTASPQPTAAPTAQPTATPELTAKPTLAPTPQPALLLVFTSLTSPIAAGSYATATVTTAPGARCSIVVEYKSGPSTAAGLEPKTANSSGIASWTWKVGTRTTPGSWPVTVTCSAGGSTKSVTQDLQVV